MNPYQNISVKIVNTPQESITLIFNFSLYSLKDDVCIFYMNSNDINLLLVFVYFIFGKCIHHLNNSVLWYDSSQALFFPQAMTHNFQYIPWLVAGNFFLPKGSTNIDHLQRKSPALPIQRVLCGSQCKHPTFATTCMYVCWYSNVWWPSSFTHTVSLS